MWEYNYHAKMASHIKWPNLYACMKKQADAEQNMNITSHV